jgi:hypothetical protein
MKVMNRFLRKYVQRIESNVEPCLTLDKLSCNITHSEKSSQKLADDSGEPYLPPPNHNPLPVYAINELIMLLE